MVEGRRRETIRNDRPVLADVALAAGVSTASVSRVLNEPDKVRPEMRQRVMAAVEQLGYVPDGAARALASGRLRTIGAIVPTLDNAIFASGINALQRRLAQRGFTLLVASSEYDSDEEAREVHALVVRGVDGLVFVGEGHDPRLYKLLASKGLPYVNTWVHSPDQPHPTIGFDNRSAGLRLADYLMDLGHRRIAMVAGFAAHNDRARARAEGVRAALAKRGLEIAPGQFLERAYDVREGREALRTLLRLPEPPTAVICGNDVQAMGALFETQAQGIAVPARLSIVGFDDLPISANLVPALTTIRVPAADIGRRAADYLLDRLAGQDPPLHTELDAELVVRGTTAPPPVLAEGG
ncbi:MAG: LacI family DNA-binding transcriptional regulator [Azoarcus sp. PHD]|nr:MAG: LacI family DNA-binding transcriptional regulator [Azoarcus sp. PHD]